MTKMVGVGIPTLRELRSAVITAAAPDAAVNALRRAGYAGGDAVLAAFERWLAESGSTDAGAPGDAGDLTLDEFGGRAAQFFRDAGWGEVAFSRDEAEGVAIVDIQNSWEGAGSDSGTGCQITTGLLAAFFGKIAGYPVAVLEAECSGSSGTQCRFLLGNADVMNYKWQEMR